MALWKEYVESHQITELAFTLNRWRCIQGNVIYQRLWNIWLF